MDTNQPSDITANMTLPETDLRVLCTELVEKLDELNCRYNVPNQSAMIERALAALAREGWRPIPKDEGAAISLFERRSNSCSPVVTAADAEAQRLAKHLQELANILTLMGFVTLEPPAWPTRLQRAAELLVRKQAPVPVPALPPRPPVTAIAPAPVLTRERPWERDGWCDEQGRCWMGDPGRGEFIPSWRLCFPWDFCNLKWSLPHWAIPVPAIGDAS